MDKSDTIASLAKALSLAQGEMKAAAMNAVNPFLKNKYADLGSVIEAARPVLVKNGLSFTQLVYRDETGIGVETVLMHASGEWISSRLSVEVGEERGKSTAQVAGSVITYLRRYALSAILGIYADEDTDGNGHEKQPQKRETEPAPVVPASQKGLMHPTEGQPEQPKQQRKATMEELRARFEELIVEAQKLGVAVSSEIPASISEEELTRRGKALAAAIKAAKA
jgi:cellobiose-specific phosphotransferase system component IIA